MGEAHPGCGGLARGAISRNRRGWQVLRTRVVFCNKHFVRVIRSLYGIYRLTEARTQKHCCLYDSRKFIEFFSASFLGRRPPIQSEVSLTDWGGAQPTLVVRCRPAPRPLARARVASVSIWSDNLRTKLLGSNSEFISRYGLRKQKVAYSPPIG